MNANRVLSIKTYLLAEARVVRLLTADPELHFWKIPPQQYPLIRKLYVN